MAGFGRDLDNLVSFAEVSTLIAGGVCVLFCGLVVTPFAMIKGIIGAPIAKIQEIRNAHLFNQYKKDFSENVTKERFHKMSEENFKMREVVLPHNNFNETYKKEIEYLKKHTVLQKKYFKSIDARKKNLFYIIPIAGVFLANCQTSDSHNANDYEFLLQNHCALGDYPIKG